jgi:hypothetical protein
MGLLNKLNEGDFATNTMRRASNYMGGGGGIANHAAAALFGQARALLLCPRSYQTLHCVWRRTLYLGTVKKVQDALLQRAPVNAAIAASNNAAKLANKHMYSNAAGQNGIPNALLQAIMLNKYGS